MFKPPSSVCCLCGTATGFSCAGREGGRTWQAETGLDNDCDSPREDNPFILLLTERSARSLPPLQGKHLAVYSTAECMWNVAESGLWMLPVCVNVAKLLHSARPGTLRQRLMLDLIVIRKQTVAAKCNERCFRFISNFPLCPSTGKSSISFPCRWRASRRMKAVWGFIRTQCCKQRTFCSTSMTGSAFNVFCS